MCTQSSGFCRELTVLDARSELPVLNAARLDHPTRPRRRKQLCPRRMRRRAWRDWPCPSSHPIRTPASVYTKIRGHAACHPDAQEPASEIRSRSPTASATSFKWVAGASNSPHQYLQLTPLVGVAWRAMHRRTVINRVELWPRRGFSEFT